MSELYTEGLLNFATAVEMLYMLDKTLTDSKTRLHPWQIEELNKLCLAKPTDMQPMKYCLCAANGSGKDKYIVAGFALWFLLTKKNSRVVLTSSSGTQLTAQTENYLRRLSQAANSFMEQFLGIKEFITINQRYIYNKTTGSEIRMFATDEPGRAEGYHPIEPGAEMAIIVNECKSVGDEIFTALENCTGFNYWVEVSTPGEPKGHFFWAFNNFPHARRITSYDCPHISPTEIDSDKKRYGEDSSIFRSRRLALFTELSGKSVIPYTALARCDGVDRGWQDWPLRVGIDLAAGGDESVISIVKGNALIKQEVFIEKDAVKTIRWIEGVLKQYKIPQDHPHVFADDGGLGRPIIDILANRGWTINRVLNQHKAHNSTDYGNKGAELWSNFARLVMDSKICLEGWSDKLKDQLTQRRYRDRNSDAKIYLQAKAEARAQGYASPDRADSLILAFCGITITDFQEKENNETINKILELRPILDAMAERKSMPYDDRIKYASFDNYYEEPRPCNGSLDCATR